MSLKFFEKEVLLGVLKELRLKDFLSFVDVFYRIGFQRVFILRLLKVYKFYYLFFQKNSNGNCVRGENVNSVVYYGL